MKPFPVLISVMLTCAVPGRAEDGGASSNLARRLRAYEERVGGTFRQTWTAASEVVVTDGVGEYEAYVLSRAYLFAYIERCSSVRTLRDEGMRWVAETLVGEPPGDPGPPGLRRESDRSDVFPEQPDGDGSKDVFDLREANLTNR